MSQQSPQQFTGQAAYGQTYYGQMGGYWGYPQSYQQVAQQVSYSQPAAVNQWQQYAGYQGYG